MSYDIFDSYYRKLENDTLTEKMSPEDEHDSAILRDIIAKTSLRTNAKVTPEEKEIRRLAFVRHVLHRAKLI